MTGYLTGGLLTAMLVFQLAASTFAQSDKTPAKETQAPKEMRLNGCITRDARAPGQFNFLESDGGGRYRLTGKNLKKFIGQPVEIVGGPPGKGVTFKTELSPSPGCPGVPLTRLARRRCPNFTSPGCAALRAPVSKFWELEFGLFPIHGD